MEDRECEREMLAVVGGGGAKMEHEFDSKLRLQDDSSNNGSRGGGGENGGKPVQRGKSFQFRAPQENFTVEDFELGKIYGVGSYSKVGILSFLVFFFFCCYFCCLILSFLVFGYNNSFKSQFYVF